MNVRCHCDVVSGFKHIATTMSNYWHHCPQLLQHCYDCYRALNIKSRIHLSLLPFLGLRPSYVIQAFFLVMQGFFNANLHCSIDITIRY